MQHVHQSCGIPPALVLVVVVKNHLHQFRSAFQIKNARQVKFSHPDHKHLVDHFQRLDDIGLAISDVTIQSMADEDDDWVELTFDGLRPENLFSPTKL